MNNKQRRKSVRFKASENGAIAVTMALSSMAIMLLMVLTIDYTRATALKSRLQAVADAAVLNALNLHNGTGEFADIARDAFFAQLDSPDRAHVASASTETTVENGTVNVKLSYTARMSTAMMASFGLGLWDIEGHATATVSETGGISGLRLHLVLDVSESMSMAATLAGRVQLRNITRSAGYGDGCEFACHTQPNLGMARANDILLRIDVVRSGAASLVEYATTNYPQNDYWFSLNAIARGSTNVVAATQSKSAILAAIDSLEVGYGVGNQDANSWFNLSIPQTVNWLNANNNNTSLDVVILVSDGLQSQNNTTDSNLIKPVDQAYCNMLKANGRKLAIIYTPYPALPGDHVYEQRVRHIVDDLEPNLRQCATPGLFAISTNPSDMSDDFEALFGLVNRTLYLSR